MISKAEQKERGDTFVKGAGRPFEMNPRYPIEKNDAERQRPVVIDLSDLNGQGGGKGMPKNFHRKAGRTLATFTGYWTDEGEDFDIE